MRITKSRLKQIIKEELDSFLAEDDFDEMDKLIKTGEETGDQKQNCPKGEKQAAAMAKVHLERTNQINDTFELMEYYDANCLKDIRNATPSTVTVTYGNRMTIIIDGQTNQI